MIRVRKKWTATECTLSVSDVDDSFHADEADFMTAISFNVRSAAGKVLIARRATGLFFGLGRRIVRLGRRIVRLGRRIVRMGRRIVHIVRQGRKIVIRLGRRIVRLGRRIVRLGRRIVRLG